MSLRKRNIIGFTILIAHMIAILILDFANITSFEWLPTFLNHIHYILNLLYQYTQNHIFDKVL